MKLYIYGTVEGVVVVGHQMEFKEFQIGAERVLIRSIRIAGSIFFRFLKAGALLRYNGEHEGFVIGTHQTRVLYCVVMPL